MRSRRRRLSPELLIQAYSCGAFPMASSRTGPIDWYSPDPRAIFALHPPDAFHLPRSLRRTLRRGTFRITHDQAFEQVIRACAEPRKQQHETWINEEIVQAYTQMHQLGLAHSVESWLDDPHGKTEPQLVGGIYGVSLGGAFFGESMFSRATDASKVCLAALVEHLRSRGFLLFDVQLSNPHLEQFGVVELPRHEFLHRLAEALSAEVTW